MKFAIHIGANRRGNRFVRDQKAIKSVARVIRAGMDLGEELAPVKGKPDPPAALGMVPVAFEWAVGLERFSPLAVVPIGGLIVGNFLTLLIVPVLLFLLLRRTYPDTAAPAGTKAAEFS